MHLRHELVRGERGQTRDGVEREEHLVEGHRDQEEEHEEREVFQEADDHRCLVPCGVGRLEC